MNENTLAMIMLILGFCLVVASVWMMRDALWAGLVAGLLLLYGATAVIRSND